MHIGAGRQLADARAPFRENLVAPAGIAAEADRAADMVQHDRGFGKGARQTDELAELGVIHPRIKAEPERGEPGEALAQLWVHQQAFRPNDRRSPGRLVGMRGGDKADAAKAAAAGADHRLQKPLDRRAERQIGVADDAGADARLAVGAAGAHRCDAVGELDLADRAQLDGTFGAVHREPFEIDARRDVVSGADIGEQLRQQIAPGLGPVHQVMMRVDDRQIGLDDLLAAAIEPVRPDRQMRADRGPR